MRLWCWNIKNQPRFAAHGEGSHSQESQVTCLTYNMKLYIMVDWTIIFIVLLIICVAISIFFCIPQRGSCLRTAENDHFFLFIIFCMKGWPFSGHSGHCRWQLWHAVPFRCALPFIWSNSPKPLDNDLFMVHFSTRRLWFKWLNEIRLVSIVTVCSSIERTRDLYSVFTVNSVHCTQWCRP